MATEQPWCVANRCLVRKIASPAARDDGKALMTLHH